MTQPSTSAQVAPSVVRTGTPLLVGYVVSLIVRHVGNVNDDNFSAILALAVSYVYYMAARFLEVGVSPKWGYILGSRKTPVYAPAPSTTTSAEGTTTVSTDGPMRETAPKRKR